MKTYKVILTYTVPGTGAKSRIRYVSAYSLAQAARIARQMTRLPSGAVTIDIEVLK